MQKLLLIFGTRPEAIKLCPVIRSLREDPSKFDVKVCVTAQHQPPLCAARWLHSMRTFRWLTWKPACALTICASLFQKK
jgi:UDP-N-acetylglucosamine 2-epimerase